MVKTIFLHLQNSADGVFSRKQNLNRNGKARRRKTELQMLQREIEQHSRTLYSEVIENQYVGIISLTEWELIQALNQFKKFNNSLQ